MQNNGKDALTKIKDSKINFPGGNLIKILLRFL